jgi:hypothetical protein
MNNDALVAALGLDAVASQALSDVVPVSSGSAS